MWKEEIDKYFAIVGGAAIAIGAMILLPIASAMTITIMVLTMTSSLAGTGKKSS